MNLIRGYRIGGTKVEEEKKEDITEVKTEEEKVEEKDD